MSHNIGYKFNRRQPRIYGTNETDKKINLSSLSDGLEDAEDIDQELADEIRELNEISGDIKQ